MTELLIEHIEWGAANAFIWGFPMIFLFMTIESSFIPFPSEVIMVPAGFLAYRQELTFGAPFFDLTIAFACGLAGSMAGAYINYFLARFLGRPFLHRYGRFFFISEKMLLRAEEIFLEYGEITTFICRLLPGIRQIISIPAGISGMPLSRFTLFTGLGAGIWSAILIGIGYYLGSLSENMTYAQLVYRSKEITGENFIWILLILIIVVICYSMCHHYIMKSRKSGG